MLIRIMHLALTVLALAPTAPTDPAGAKIVGEWRGKSLCTNLKLSPACKDETTRFVFTGPGAGSDTFHVVADKLVAGSFATMGEFDLEYGSAKGMWTHELDVPSCVKCMWWFRVEGAELVGGLTDGSGEALRKVSAKRGDGPGN